MEKISVGVVGGLGHNDVRDSHSLPIVKQLISLGAKLTVHDPGSGNIAEAVTLI